MTSDNAISPPINVPEWNLRTTLSFSSHLFNKALYMQTGITGHYFTNFYADQYNPLLGDFMRQDRQVFISSTNMPTLLLLAMIITVPWDTLIGIVS